MANGVVGAAYTGWVRADWVGLFARLTDGFIRAVPAGGSPAAARLPGVAADDRVPSIEGFARMSVGWAAWLHEPANPATVVHDGRRHDIGAIVARGLADATDPGHPAWWGPIPDRDQRIVEAAEVSTALLLGGMRLRAELDRIDPAAFDRVLDWLALVDGRDVWPDNWVLFPMMTAVARRQAGRPIPDAQIDEAIDWMLVHHVGDGWYSDGAGHALDLYTGWAIHWHLLWWTMIEGARRPGRRALIERRARAWLAGTAALVAADGSVPRFGRSLGYRFALAAPFVQAALLGIDPLEPGLARRLASGIVANALAAGAVDPARDWLRVGVGAERPAVVEGYVTSGAVAWAAHAFVALAMPATHPFWSAPEAPLPADLSAGGSIAAGRAGLLTTWTARGDTRLHNARSGHPADIPGHDYSATYGKLAYRSAFPCDVPVPGGSSAGADDAVVALDIEPRDRPPHAVRGDRSGHRAETASGSAGPGWILARYRLEATAASVTVRTAVLVLDDAEIRISLVSPAAGRRVRMREGSAVLGGTAGDRVELGRFAGGAVLSHVQRGTVGCRILLGYDVVGCAESTGRANLVHDESSLVVAEESVGSSERRLVATASVAWAGASASPVDRAMDGVADRTADGGDEGDDEDASRALSDATGVLEAISLRQGSSTAVEVVAPRIAAAIFLGSRPPFTVSLGGHQFHGPGLRLVRAAPDGSSFAGERISSVDGAFRLDRPGVVSVRRGDAVEATVSSGIRIERAWAGSGMTHLSIRRGANRQTPVGILDEPGVVPDALVRRLVRAGGTSLVELRLGHAP
ncbi:MAG: hypothetical protein QOF49_1151 [Chloroflexota bacterium]|nr:hypothetical protein [Chloroflexota bacterium]